MEDRVARVDTGGAELACFVDGPDDGKVALCVHGFPDCARSFRHQVAPLVAAGFRVVRPSLRAYAPSTAARDGRYDAGALADDLCALARHFSPRAPIVLIGHDWGAIASYAAVAKAPSQFSRLVTVAVPHLRSIGPRFATRAQLRRSWYIGLFQLRGIAEARVRRDRFAFIDRLWRDWSPGYRAPPEELDAVKAALTPHLTGVLGYYRAILTLGALAGDTRALLMKRTPVRSLYVHGIDDGCMGIELVDGAERGYAGPIELVRLKNAGHFAHLEQPDAFNRALLRFLET